MFIHQTPVSSLGKIQKWKKNPNTVLMMILIGIKYAFGCKQGTLVGTNLIHNIFLFFVFFKSAKQIVILCNRKQKFPNQCKTSSKKIEIWFGFIFRTKCTIDYQWMFGGYFQSNLIVYKKKYNTIFRCFRGILRKRMPKMLQNTCTLPLTSTW